MNNQDNKQPAQKPIKMPIRSWLEVDELATELAEERGGTKSLPNAVAEAVRFFKENRPKSTKESL